MAGASAAMTLGGAEITAEAKWTPQAEEVEVDQTVRLNVPSVSGLVLFVS